MCGRFRLARGPTTEPARAQLCTSGGEEFRRNCEKVAKSAGGFASIYPRSPTCSIHLLRFHSFHRKRPVSPNPTLRDLCHPDFGRILTLDRSRLQLLRRTTAIYSILSAEGSCRPNGRIDQWRCASLCRDGREGRGIERDITTLWSREEYAAGENNQLECALRR